MAIGMNELNLRVRKATLEDCSRLEWVKKVNPAAHEFFVSSIRQQFSQPRSVAVFVGHKGNNNPVVAGIVSCRKDKAGVTATLETVFTHPDERHQGFARAVLRKRKQYAISHFGADRIITRVVDPRGRQLYLDEGFVPVSGVQLEFKLGKRGGAKRQP